jgi:hypothetical protein
MINPVMQVDFNFSPAGMTMIGNAVDQTSVILLRRIEVSVYQRPPFLVAPPIHSSRVCGAPVFHAALLFGKGGARSTIFRHNGRFEVIGNSNDQMQGAARSGSGKPLPGIARQPTPVREFLEQAGSRARPSRSRSSFHPTVLFAHRSCFNAFKP